jgi:hypothetical protein
MVAPFTPAVVQVSINVPLRNTIPPSGTIGGNRFNVKTVG